MNPLPARFWAKVNKTSTCWLWTGCRNSGGYGQLKVDGRALRVHRLSYAALVAPIPEGMFVDHICFNRLCVRPEHLRLATNKQNSEHRRGAQVNSITGIRGVSPALGGFTAKINHNGRRISLGTFKTAAEAHEAYSAAALKLFTHY